MSAAALADVSPAAVDRGPVLRDVADTPPTAAELAEAREWLIAVGADSAFRRGAYAAPTARSVLHSVLRGDTAPGELAYRARMALALAAVADENPGGTR